MFVRDGSALMFKDESSRGPLEAQLVLIDIEFGKSLVILSDLGPEINRVGSDHFLCDSGFGGSAVFLGFIGL